MSGERILLGGRVVELAEQPLKNGGQASVYEVVDVPGVVVKRYHVDQPPEQARRLELMTGMNPLGRSSTHTAQPPELAWPLELAFSQDGRFIGYSMWLFGEPKHIRLQGLFDQRLRRMYFDGRADWRFLLGVAFNLAFMTARMHYQGLIVGDFSPNNVVVDRGGFVTLLDCDSIVFTDEASGEVFGCPVQTKEYSAPERQADGPATRQTDDFALAVLIYQLLSAGNHPFGGVRMNSDSDPTPEGNIVSRSSYVVRPEAVRTPPGIVQPGVLPPRLLTMARQAFGPGLDEPRLRPMATDWVRALGEERSQIRECPDRPHHFYGGHLPACPWCERPRDLFGDGRKPDPGRRGPISAVPPSAPRPKPAPDPKPAAKPRPKPAPKPTRTSRSKARPGPAAKPAPGRAAQSDSTSIVAGIVALAFMAVMAVLVFYGVVKLVTALF